MIFATVGTQLPFPRLIDALDALAPDLDEEIVAQVGPSDRTWANIRTHATLPPGEFQDLFRAARVVVAHAGIGSILSARQWQKPLIILPRRFAMGEHRNDHQIATARQVADLTGIHVAWQVEDIPGLLRDANLSAPRSEQDGARSALIDRLKTFIDDKPA